MHFLRAGQRDKALEVVEAMDGSHNTSALDNVFCGMAMADGSLDAAKAEYERNSSSLYELHGDFNQRGQLDNALALSAFARSTGSTSRYHIGGLIAAGELDEAERLAGDDRDTASQRAVRLDHGTIFRIARGQVEPLSRPTDLYERWLRDPAGHWRALLDASPDARRTLLAQLGGGAFTRDTIAVGPADWDGTTALLGVRKLSADALFRRLWPLVAPLPLPDVVAGTFTLLEAWADADLHVEHPVQAGPDSYEPDRPTRVRLVDLADRCVVVLILRCIAHIDAPTPLDTLWGPEAPRAKALAPLFAKLPAGPFLRKTQRRGLPPHAPAVFATAPVDVD